MGGVRSAGRSSVRLCPGAILAGVRWTGIYRSTRNGVVCATDPLDSVVWSVSLTFQGGETREPGRRPRKMREEPFRGMDREGER